MSESTTKKSTGKSKPKKKLIGIANEKLVYQGNTYFYGQKIDLSENPRLYNKLKETKRIK